MAERCCSPACSEGHTFSWPCALSPDTKPFGYLRRPLTKTLQRWEWWALWWSVAVCVTDFARRALGR